MAKHAFLSASASYRWLSCPPSAKLCAEQEDQVSPYAIIPKKILSPTFVAAIENRMLPYKNWG